VTAQLKQVAEAAIPVLEEIGDDEGLARAWYSLCQVGLMWCHASDMETASEQAAFHAERAGDRAALTEAAVARMAAPSLGMGSPEAGIRRCEEMHAMLPDDRLIEALTYMSQGECAAQLGLFDEGRRMHRRGEGILLDLGQKLWLGGVCLDAGGLEALAGDLDAAELSFRRGMEMLEAIGELGFRSTQAVSLAYVLYDQGRFAEAAEMVDLSEGLGASDDVVNQINGRGIRAKLLGREGRIEDAVAMAEEAAAMTDGIDFWDPLTSAWENLGEVYRLAGQRDDAVRALRQALDVCERKGAVAAVELIRPKLTEVEATS
jgi:tetratricopeptide (TPR) repeat protein